MSITLYLCFLHTSLLTTIIQLLLIVCSRESLGSVLSAAPAAGPTAGATSSSSGGFQIFEDSAPAGSQLPATAAKRKGLGAYSGV